MLADDKIAGIGTVNLDYRSWFLHFECNAVFYKADIICDLKKDYLATQNESRERTEGDIKKGSVISIRKQCIAADCPLL